MTQPPAVERLGQQSLVIVLRQVLRGVDARRADKDQQYSNHQHCTRSELHGLSSFSRSHSLRSPALSLPVNLYALAITNTAAENFVS
jgi:hypothetical protein